MTTGHPLYIPSQCLPYRLLTRDSTIVPNAVLSDRLANAFAAWLAPNPSCTPGISAIELAPSASTTIVGFDIHGRNENLVGVPTTWTHGNDAETLVVATLTFDQATGEILGVDVELNPTVKWSWVDPTPADATDLQTALTHAVGHMLGLAHSEDPNAVMIPTYDAGTTRRVLSADDQQAICTVYPSRTQRFNGTTAVPATPCDLAATNGSGTCGDPDITHGCSATGESPAFGAMILVAVGLVVARRRRPV